MAGRVFKKNLTPLKKRGPIHTHVGKGAVETTLPHPSAMQTLTAGSPMQRTMNDYAKATPMASPNMETPNILGE